MCCLLLSIFFVWTTTICSFSCWWSFGLFSVFFLANLSISWRTEHSCTHLCMNSVFILLGKCSWWVACLKEAFRLFHSGYTVLHYRLLCVWGPYPRQRLELSVVGGGISLWFKSTVLSWWMMLSLFPSMYLLLWCIFSSFLRAFFCFV